MDRGRRLVVQLSVGDELPWGGERPVDPASTTPPANAESPPGGFTGAGTARVIAVVNQKGGVGKTTTAVNLAASLAAAEQPTLLVDLDPQANATSAYGLVGDAPNVYDVLVDGRSVGESSRSTELPRLRVLPSSPDLVSAEIEIVGLDERESRLRSALEGARGEFAYVIIDCPPSLGLLTLNALVAADAVLIPLQCEYYALEGLARLVDTVDRVRAINPVLALEGIVLTMVDLRANLARQVADEVRGHFGQAVYETVIPRNVRLSEAPSHGKPILLYDIQSKGAAAYLRLAEEFLKRDRARGLAPPPDATDKEREA